MWHCDRTAKRSLACMVVLCKARPEAVSQAKPSPNRPSRARPCWRLHGGFGPACVLEKPKPSRQATAFHKQYKTTGPGMWLINFKFSSTVTDPRQRRVIVDTLTSGIQDSTSNLCWQPPLSCQCASPPKISTDRWWTTQNESWWWGMEMMPVNGPEWQKNGATTWTIHVSLYLILYNLSNVLRYLKNDKRPRPGGTRMTMTPPYSSVHSKRVDLQLPTRWGPKVLGLLTQTGI